MSTSNQMELLERFVSKAHYMIQYENMTFEQVAETVFRGQKRTLRHSYRPKYKNQSYSGPRPHPSGKNYPFLVER